MTYFTAALTSPQLTKLRGAGTSDRAYAANQLLFMCPNAPVFNARSNGAVTGQPVGQIAYDTVTFGAYTDIKVGQRVTISPTNNIMDRNAVTGRIRATPSSTILYVNEISVDIPDNSYLFVTNDYPLMDRLARITQTDPTYVQSKDFDLAYEPLPPLVAGIQMSYVQRVDSLTGVATFSLDASASYATDNSSFVDPIASFLWEFDDPGAVNVIGGGTTEDNIEFEIDEGFQWASLTIEDSVGTQTIFHFQLHPWGDTYTPVLGFDGASLSGDIQNGYGVSAIAFTQVSTVLDNTWVTIVRSPEYYNSTAGQLIDGDAYYMDFVGFLSTENSQERSDELYSTINEVSFEITGIAQRLAQIEMQAIGMRNQNSPTVWDYIEQLMPWRAVVHIWARHSTASTLVPLMFTNDVKNTSYTYPYLNTQLGGTLLSGINYILNGINASLEMWPNGSCEGVRDIRYISEANRPSYITLFGITVSDLYDISIQWQHIPPTGKVYAEGGSFNNISNAVTAYKSIAPGTAQAIGANTGALGQQILTVTAVQSEGQAELNQRAGNYFSILNDDGNTLTLSVPGGYGAAFYPSRNILYTLTYDDPVRGISYTTDTKWMCIAVNISHNNDTGSRTVQVTLQRLIPFAAPGDTIPQIAEGDISPAIPDLPPFPAFNSEFPEFSFPLDGLDLSAINPSALNPPAGQVAKKDGSTLIIKSNDQAYLLSNVIIAATPLSYEVTPSDLETDFEIQQTLFDPLNTGSNKPTANRYAYLLESDGTNSHVQRTANIFAKPPTWLTGDDIDRLYNVLRSANVDGALLAYSAIGDTSGSVSLTYDFGSGPSSASYGTPVTLTAGAHATPPSNGQYNLEFNLSPCTLVEYVSSSGWTDIDGVGGVVAWNVIDCDSVQHPVSVPADINDFATQNAITVGINSVTSFTVTFIFHNISSDAVVRYSSDRGATWGSELTIGATPGTVGGFDVSRASGVSYAACAAKARKATSLGGSYSDFIAFTGANPRAICIPYFRIGTYPTAQQTAASDPDLYVGLDVADGGGHSMYKCTGAGTKTGITPTSGFIFESANAITSSYGDEVAVIGLVSGDRRLYRSVNAGGTWTLEASSLSSNALFIRTRRGDNRRAKLGSGHGQGYLINGLTADYSVDWYATLGTRNLPIACNGMDILG